MPYCNREPKRDHNLDNHPYTDPQPQTQCERKRPVPTRSKAPTAAAPKKTSLVGPKIVWGLRGTGSRIQNMLRIYKFRDLGFRVWGFRDCRQLRDLGV